MARRDSLLWILGAAAVGGALFATRRSAVSLFGRAVAAGKELQFKLSLPARAQPYADLILQVAREKKLDPYLIFAIGDRESRWGEALKPPGPAGTGDFTARTWGPFPMPPDGLGWGRGIMQLDYENAKGLNWRDPLTNIRAGADHILRDLQYFKSIPSTPTIVKLSAAQAERRGVLAGTYADPRPLTGNALWEAAIAAYNTGAGNVLWNLAAGQPAQYTTTKGDYVADVTSRASSAASRLG